MERTENSVLIRGYLGAEPEIRWYDPETCAVRLSLATHSPTFVDSEGREQLGEVTDWHRVVCYRDLARQSVDELHEGDLVLVEGRIAYLKHYNQRGEARRSTVILASRVELVSRKREESHTELPEEQPNDPYGKYLDTLAEDSNGLPF